MTARAVLVVAAAGLVAAACTPDRPPETADPGATEATTCHREQAELDRRDEAGTIDWEAIEGPDEELTDEELASVTIERDPFPGDVAADEERPTFPDFPDRLDVATLSDAELVAAVDICYEVGLLADEETGDAETG